MFNSSSVVRSALGIAFGVMLAGGSAQALPAVGSHAAPIDLPTIYGQRFKLSSIEGRAPIVLNFFSSF